MWQWIHDGRLSAADTLLRALRRQVAGGIFAEGIPVGSSCADVASIIAAAACLRQVWRMYGIDITRLAFVQEWVKGFNELLDRAQRLSHERYGAYIKLAKIGI